MRFGADDARVYVACALGVSHQGQLPGRAAAARGTLVLWGRGLSKLTPMPLPAVVAAGPREAKWSVAKWVVRDPKQRIKRARVDRSKMVICPLTTSVCCSHVMMSKTSWRPAADDRCLTVLAVRPKLAGVPSVVDETDYAGSTASDLDARERGATKSVSLVREYVVERTGVSRRAASVVGPVLHMISGSPVYFTRLAMDEYKKDIRGGPGGGGRVPGLPSIILDNRTPGVGGPRINRSSLDGEGVVEGSRMTAAASGLCEYVGVDGPVANLVSSSALLIAAIVPGSNSKMKTYQPPSSRSW